MTRKLRQNLFSRVVHLEAQDTEKVSSINKGEIELIKTLENPVSFLHNPIGFDGSCSEHGRKSLVVEPVMTSRLQEYCKPH